MIEQIGVRSRQVSIKRWADRIVLTVILVTALGALLDWMWS